MFVDVGAVEEFVEGRPRVVQLSGREVGVLAWRGEVFAVRNICPHQYGPVCRGSAMPLIVSDQEGVMDLDENTPVIICPWHGWEFEARTGRAAWGESPYKLKTYPVKIEAGRVLVDPGRTAEQPRSDAPRDGQVSRS